MQKNNQIFESLGLKILKKVPLICAESLESSIIQNKNP